MGTLDLDQFWPLPPFAQTPVARSPALPTRDAEWRGGDGNSGATALPEPDPAVPSFADIEPMVGPLVEPEPRTPSAASARLRSVRGHLGRFDAQAAVWLSAGFVAGMVSWHAVGFWSFVSASVLNGPAARAPVQVAVQPAPPQASSAPLAASAPSPNAAQDTAQITTGSLATFVPLPGACMALTVDRTSGATLARPCNLGDQPMRDAGRRRKADRMPGADARLQAPSVWASATTATPAANELTAEDRQAAPLEASDFDLKLRVEPQ